MEEVIKLLHQRKCWHIAQRDAINELSKKIGHDMCAVECELLMQRVRDLT